MNGEAIIPPGICNTIREIYKTRREVSFFTLGLNSLQLFQCSFEPTLCSVPASTNAESVKDFI